MKNLYKSWLLMLSLCGIQKLNAQVPALSSYPSATAVIFLDFDGHLVSGTSWNTAGDINCNPSGLDADQITVVFNRVAEDFRPFNINITTDEAVFNLAPINKRVRVIITTSHEWYGTGAGGVAYLNSFTWSDDTPAFVFSALHNFNLKNIAEATSHESGHTLGLRHQSTYDAHCIKTSDYNWGIGSGEIGWAPIMGAGYNRNMTLWHEGANSTGCSVIQSDLSIITNSTNGFGYRTDDYSDVYATATTAAFNGAGQFNINGIIERTDDKDLFKFTVPAFGRFQLNAIPYNVGTGNSGSDVDLQIDLVNSSYSTIGTYNPGALLNSIMDTLLNAGTYYLRVDGKGNIYAPEYASLGSYALQGALSEGSALPLRRLELRGQLNQDMHILNWLIDADEKVIKQVIEVSNDGRNFAALDQPGISERTFSYSPQENNPLQYRIHVTFDNYKQYYSNIITIRRSSTSKPQLTGNIISGNSVSVNSPDNYKYQIVDQSGRTMSKGTVSKGFSSINTGYMANGIYIIRFSSEDQSWTEKFIKK